MKKKTKDSKNEGTAKAVQNEEDDDKVETAKMSRISAVQSDPIFHEMRKSDKKVKIDSRFKAIFDDERFASTRAKVDRHGRPINKEKDREDLRNLYELEESEELEKR